MAVDQQKMRMLAALLRTPKQSETMNALAQRYANPPPSNWLSKPLPMEGRFNLLPIREEVPGMGPSVFNKRSAALPGVLAAAVNAFTAPGRAMSQPGFDPNREGVEFGMNVLGGGLLGSRMAPAPRGSIGMNAYHGSPHKFDAFDISKIGTGEGAQAYGHGLYFSENPHVAGSYRTGLTRAMDSTVQAGNVKTTLPPWLANKVDAEGVDVAINEWTSRIGQMQNELKTSTQPWIIEGNISRMQEQLGALKQIKAAGNVSVEKPGAFYHVDIPDEAIGRMLDWDKPLSQQPENVRRALGSMGDSPAAISAYDDALLNALMKDGPDPGKTPRNPTGQDVYQSLVRELGSPQAASKRLGELGIPGLRYLDGGSRRGGDGTRNFVLFDDKLARITKRE
jgi:hypothetical protein